MPAEGIRNKLIFWLRVLIIVFSICFLFSAISNLLKYSAQEPNITVTGEDVYIRGVPVFKILWSSVIAGLLSIIERFINLIIPSNSRQIKK
jgi:hypothetical protein